VFQFVKQYGDAAAIRTRTLNKLVAGTPRIAIGGVEQLSGFTVDVNTGEVTFSSPPASGVITGGCEFHVPVRFSNDTDEWLSVSFDDFGTGSASVELVEIKATVPIAEALRLGGYADRCLDSDEALASGSARLQTIDPDGSAIQLKLPPLGDLLPGGPHYYIINIGDSGTIEIVDENGDSFAPPLVLDPREGVAALVGVDSAGAKLWYLI
jgi:hypothetical protein